MNIRALHRFWTSIIETSKIIEKMIEIRERGEMSAENINEINSLKADLIKIKKSSFEDFCKSEKASRAKKSKIVLDLEKRIIKAKQIVKYTSYGNMIFLENYQEVIDVLQYEDTLGMALFVREFIARQTPTGKCVKYLLRDKN